MAPSGDANAYQIDPAHDGAVDFSSSTVTFPPPSSWHVNIGAGTPSNVVIADSMIFLTTGTSGGSQLLALSSVQRRRRPGVRWRFPAPPGGSAGVAYDSEQVFVTQQDADSSGSTLYAYNAGTGALIGARSWARPRRELLPWQTGTYMSSSAGSATLYALNESTGALAGTSR